MRLPAGLTENAIKAVCKLEFKPVTKGGQPVSQWVDVEYVSSRRLVNFPTVRRKRGRVTGENALFPHCLLPVTLFPRSWLLPVSARHVAFRSLQLLHQLFYRGFQLTVSAGQVVCR